MSAIYLRSEALPSYNVASFLYNQNRGSLLIVQPIVVNEESSRSLFHAYLQEINHIRYARDRVLFLGSHWPPVSVPTEHFVKLKKIKFQQSKYESAIIHRGILSTEYFVISLFYKYLLRSLHKIQQSNVNTDCCLQECKIKTIHFKIKIRSQSTEEMDETFSNRCRACAGLQDESKTMVSLFERNLFEMFIHCTSLEVIKI